MNVKSQPRELAACGAYRTVGACRASRTVGNER